MTRLSVNINKVALLRNSRGGNLPDVMQFARDCEAYDAEGITVHPRPDQRHIRFDDVYALKEVVTTEYNIEGYPSEHFLKMVCEVKPHQCTLVPDPPYALTSDTGWDTRENREFLTEVIARLHSEGIRTSLFLDPDPGLIESTAATGTDRIELYTGKYAGYYHDDRQQAVEPFRRTAQAAHEAGLGVNAGHDLNLDNLAYFSNEVPWLAEVSIGHALVADALYFGLQNVIGMYLRELRR